jgi:NADH-quinone oxidoreductase subunit L
MVALFTAFLTAFYVLRLLVVVFFGKPRSQVARASTESSFVMIGPLVLLALLSLFGGAPFFAQSFLVIPHEKEFLLIVPVLALVAMLLGASLAIWLYRRRPSDPLDIDLLRNRFYIDDFYDWLIESTQGLLARVSAFFDRWIIDAGVVRGASGGTWGMGALLRLFQVGNLQAYSFLFGLGVVVLIYFTVFR